MIFAITNESTKLLINGLVPMIYVFRVYDTNNSLINYKDNIMININKV